MARIAADIPDAERVAPFCRYYGACGGCAVQEWAPAPYLAWKRGLVVSALAQAGLTTEVAEIVDAHGEGRRRVTLHARRGADGALRTGFAAAQSHEIVAIEACPILAPGLAGACDAARTIADVLASTNKPLDIQVTATDDGLDVDVRGSGPINPALTARLSRMAEAHRLARLTRHGEIVVQRTPPRLTIGRATVPLPAGSFLQATQAGEDALGRLVIPAVGRSKHIADLFCGVGPFALRLAEKAKVDAFDSEVGAIDALRKAVALTPKLKPIQASVRDLFRRPLVPQEMTTYDAVVFDPPRQGAEAQAAQLARSRVPLVVGVSCNVATFVRDAKILTGGGYRLECVTPVDQFRHTPHVELVGVFRR